jgi:inosose dehydratase
MSTRRSERIWSRRAILEIGGGLVGSLALGTVFQRAVASSKDDDGVYSPFKMGLQSYSLRGLVRDGHADLQLALDATKELGLHYWESYVAHLALKSDPESVAAAKQVLAGSGVSVAGYGVVPLSKDEAANRRYFEFAKAMGIEYLSADPTPDSFDVLDKLVAEFDIAVGIHNHGPGHRYAKIATIAKAIEGHHAKIGCCIDTGHFLRSKEDPVDAVAAFGKRVYGVHLKDVKDAQSFTVLGQGDLRTVDLLKALARNKYNYCLAIEYEEKPESPLGDIKACLAEAARAIAEVRKG